MKAINAIVLCFALFFIGRHVADWHEPVGAAKAHMGWILFWFTCGIDSLLSLRRRR